MAILPENVRAALANPPEVSFDSVAPRRREFERLYAERAAEAGFDGSIDPNLAFDMILGTAIARLLAHRRSFTEEESEQLAEVVVRGLRA